MLGIPAVGTAGVSRGSPKRDGAEEVLNAVEWWGASTLDYCWLPSVIPCSIGPTLYPHSDAHSSFTASKTVNRLLSIRISRLKVNERFTETRRESARPLARSSTELTKSSVAAKSNSK
ncbi:MAG: hypothetical protein QM702_22975 [Rubrivivax sp.]